MNNTTSAGGFTCGPGIDAFRTSYVSIHGYASLIVCVFGSIANGLNIAVLTRREMTSPTNAILTGLAVADMVVMLEYIPYAFHAYLYHRPKKDKYTYAWSFFVMVHSILAQIFHTISIWLTVTLAVWRYIAVAHPQKNREWCSYRRTIFTIGAAYVVCPLICYPLYLQTEVKSATVTLDPNYSSETNWTAALVQNDDPENVTLYYVGMTDSAKSLGNLNFWIYSVVIKLIPCVALTFLSLRLIVALLEAKKRRKKLTQNATKLVKVKGPEHQQQNNNGAEENNADGDYNAQKKRRNSRMLDKEKQADRTTRMLVAVLLLFLLTEFPQGIMGLLKVILGEDFFRTCYMKLGELGYYDFYLYKN